MDPANEFHNLPISRKKLRLDHIASRIYRRSGLTPEQSRSSEVSLPERRSEVVCSICGAVISLDVGGVLTGGKAYSRNLFFKPSSPPPRIDDLASRSIATTGGPAPRSFILRM